MSNIDYNNLVKKNPYLNVGNNIVKECFEVISNIIPINSRANFEENIKSLRIIYDDLGIFKEYKEDYPFYNIKENTIVFPYNYFKAIYNESGILKDKDFYNISIKNEMIHELLHVASCKRLKEGNINGFGYIASYDIDNIAFTEGYVDYLVKKNYKHKYNNYKYSSSYKELINNAMVLEHLVGERELKDIFFNTKGIGEVYNIFTKYGLSKDTFYTLIKNNCLYYQLHFDNIEEGIVDKYLGLVNFCFNDMLRCKAMYMKYKDISDKEILSYVEQYGNLIVDNDKLIVYGKDPKKYGLINESLRDYKSLKDGVKTKLKVLKK